MTMDIIIQFLDCVVKDHIQDISTSQLHFGMNMKMDSTYLSYLDFEENKYQKYSFQKSINLNFLEKN